MSVALCFQHEATGRLIEELSPVQRDLRHVIPFTTTCLNRYELLAERFRSCNTQYGVIASGLFKLHYFSIKLKVLIVAFPHFGAYRNDFHGTRQPFHHLAAAGPDLFDERILRAFSRAGAPALPPSEPTSSRVPVPTATRPPSSVRRSVSWTPTRASRSGPSRHHHSETSPCGRRT